MRLAALLARRYQQPEWAIFFEVGNATGANIMRHADAVAVNIWASRGHAVHGFECKVSRADWQRELKDPGKADPIMKFCDHWWLVSEKGVALPSEIPQTWGHMIVMGKEAKRFLRVAKDAPKLEPHAITRGFMAALLRRVGDTTVPKADVDRVVAEKIENALERDRSNRTYESAGLKRAHDSIKRSIEEFERASGLKIDTYNAGDMGRAVTQLMKDQQALHVTRCNLERAKRELTAAASVIDDALKEIP